MDAVLQQLDDWLATHRPTFRSALRPGATDGALGRFAAGLDHPLPEAFRALYRWHDGQAEGVLESLDRFGMFQPLERVQATMRELDELAAAGDFPHPLWWSSAWLPFLWSGGGSYLCLDLGGSFDGHPGQVLELVGDELERIVWFPSLAAWLQILVAGLAEGVLVVRDGDVDLPAPDRYEPFIGGIFPGYPRIVPLDEPDADS